MNGLRLNRVTVLRLCGLAILLALALPSGPAGAEGEWRVYRNPGLGFQVLYPSRLKLHGVRKGAVGRSRAVAAWQRTGTKTSVRLTVIEKPGEMSMQDWATKELGGKAAAYTIAGRPAFVQEGVFDGQLTTDVYLEAPKSGRVLNFSHVVKGLQNWQGQSVIKVKRPYRDQLTDFWNMVESIKFAD